MASAVSAVAQLYDARLCREIIDEVMEAAVETREAANLVMDLVIERALEVIGNKPQVSSSVILSPTVKMTSPAKNEEKESKARKSLRVNKKELPLTSDDCMQDHEIDKPLGSPPIIVKIPKLVLSPIKLSPGEPNLSQASPSVSSSKVRESTSPRVKLVMVKEPAAIKDCQIKKQQPISKNSHIEKKVHMSPELPAIKIKESTIPNDLKVEKNISPKIPSIRIKEPISPKTPLLTIKPLSPPSALTVKKLKIRLDEPKVNKLKIAIKGRKAAKIVKNSRMLKKKRIKEVSKSEVVEKSPQPPSVKVSKVTVLKMSEIISMKPKKVLEVSPKTDTSRNTQGIDDTFSSSPDNAKNTSAILDTKVVPADFNTPIKDASIPELQDEFSNLGAVTSATSRRMVVKDPKLDKTSPKKLKTRIPGIKPFKAKKKVAPAVPEKKKTALQLIMDKIPPVPIAPPAMEPLVPIFPAVTKSRRHSSGGQRKEEWVTSPAPLVAKKSRPEDPIETVTFSLPPGGFKGARRSEPVPWRRVDELFMQFYPDVNSEDPQLSSREIVSEIIEVVLGEVEARVHGDAGTQVHHVAAYNVNHQRLVSCKGMQAVIDFDRYTSGDQGECILMEQGWITPDLFLQRSGHRSKNHRKGISVEGSADLGTVLDKIRGKSPENGQTNRKSPNSRKSPTPPARNTPSPTERRPISSQSDRQSSPTNRRETKAPSPTGRKPAAHILTDKKATNMPCAANKRGSSADERTAIPTNQQTSTTDRQTSQTDLRTTSQTEQRSSPAERRACKVDLKRLSIPSDSVLEMTRNSQKEDTQCEKEADTSQGTVARSPPKKAGASKEARRLAKEAERKAAEEKACEERQRAKHTGEIHT